MTRAFWCYWLIGCVLVGAGLGLHESRCPNDPFPHDGRIVASVAVWPAGIVWGVVNSRLPACKVLP